MSKCEWKECMEGTINELVKIEVPGKQGEIKNKFLGILKKLKAIESKPQRGGTRIIGEDGKDNYKCDYKIRNQECKINNGLGEGIIHASQVQRYRDKHYHFTCYMNRLNRQRIRRERSGEERARSRDRYYDKKAKLADLEIQQVTENLRARRWERIVDYIYGLGTVTVGGYASYQSYHITALITGYLLQWAMVSFPSWNSYEVRKAGERAEREMQNHQNDMNWRLRNGFPVPTPRPDDKPLAIGCENSNGLACRWNQYWGNYAEINNEGHLALPDSDPTGQLDQTRWDTFRLGARQFWEQGRNGAQQFWNDLTHNPLGAYESIGLLGDIIWQSARLVDNILPIVVAFWIFHFFAMKALERINRPNNNNKKKPDSGGRKRRKRTRRKRKRKRRKKTRRKRRR
jgi:hypothetical protein